MNSLFAQENAAQPEGNVPGSPVPGSLNDANNAETTALTATDTGNAAPGKQQHQQDGGFQFLMVMLPAVLIFYWFFMLRPQQKQQDQQRKILDGLDKNDKVLTVGGIIGTVHSVDKEKNEIILKVDDSSNAKIRFALGAVQTVFPKDEDKVKGD